MGSWPEGRADIRELALIAPPDAELLMLSGIVCTGLAGERSFGGTPAPDRSLAIEDALWRSLRQPAMMWIGNEVGDPETAGSVEFGTTIEGDLARVSGGC